MPPNLRPVIAQVHRNSRSIGSRRNFSSIRPGSSNESNGAGETDIAWFVRRGLALAAGYGLGAYILGDAAAEYEEKRQESLRMTEELFEQSENAWSDLAAHGLKSRVALVSDRKS